jgi:hypothetical protein
MSQIKHTLNPAHGVVRMLGGCQEIGRSLGVHASTVSRWSKDAKTGGTGGRIPQKHWAALASMAQDKGVALSIEQLAGLRLKR